MDEFRRALLEWRTGEDELAPQAHLGDPQQDWYKGRTFNVLPSKAEQRSAIEGSLLGWKPERPIIHSNTRVLAFGSCFASHFILWLGDHGFNQNAATSPYDMLLRYGFSFENVPVIAQQFRWAFGDFDASQALWIDTGKQLVEATEERRRSVRESLEKAEVLILTLGLSEIWYDKVTREPLWRAVPRRYFDEERHAFRVLSAAETLSAFEEIHSLIERFLPGLKVVFTVSPVRLRATFRPISALTANSVSKAILRSALDEFLRAHPEKLNRSYFYFPSYELVTEVMREPFVDDNRHLYPSVVERALALFARHYTSLPLPESGPASEASPSDQELLDRIAELERRSVELQKVCDERLHVIEELDRAARERLEVIERLDALCKQLEKSSSSDPLA